MREVRKSPREGVLRRAAGALAAGLLLSGCLLDIFDDDPPTVRRPEALSPEQDLFADGALRTFSWTEGIDRADLDTLLRSGSVTITRLGDSVAGGDTLVRVSLASTAGSAAVATQLGLNPARLALDSAQFPDPGPSLRFPAAPAVGWRLDTTVGDLRFVRVLTGTQTQRSLGKDVQCWVFAESTYLAGTPVSTGTYWMGRTGLVRHRREWKDYASTNLVGGTLWREVKAVKN